MKKNVEKSIKMIIFLMIISTICIGLLGGVESIYNVVKVKVLNAQIFQETLGLFGIPYTVENYEQLFAENFTTEKKGNSDFYVSKIKDPGAVVLTADGSGLWSRIEVLVAVSSDYDHLYGMRILSHGETPGLGGRIEELPFQNSFAGKSVRPQIKLLKITSNDNEVDAITGATKTSDAVAEIINKAVVKLDRVYLGKE